MSADALHREIAECVAFSGADLGGELQGVMGRQIETSVVLADAKWRAKT